MTEEDLKSTGTGKQRKAPEVVKQEDDGELEHDVVAAWEEIKARQDA